MLGGHPILKVCYPEKWSISNSLNENIKVAKSEDYTNEWFYYSVDENITLDDLFELVEQTANINLSAIAKFELLKAKINELKEFFSAHNLEELERMKFVVEEEVLAKPKKARGRKKKEVETEEIKEETVESDA